MCLSTKCGLGTIGPFIHLVEEKVKRRYTPAPEQEVVNYLIELQQTKLQINHAWVLLLSSYLHINPTLLKFWQKKKAQKLSSNSSNWLFFHVQNVSIWESRTVNSTSEVPPILPHSLHRLYNPQKRGEMSYKRTEDTYLKFFIMATWSTLSEQSSDPFQPFTHTDVQSRNTHILYTNNRLLPVAT